MSRIVFITGTDTGVGKTLLTGLLLHYLRQSGCHALALKPFCCGSRADVEFLGAVQERELTQDEINPFFFELPLAPLVAARKQHVSIRLPAVLRHISNVAKRCEWLLIEGIGGVMVPLGKGFTVLDLITTSSRCLRLTNPDATVNSGLPAARVYWVNAPPSTRAQNCE